MATIDSLCVYCGSSDRGGDHHLNAAGDLGRLAAERGVHLVFGGGRVGLMGAMAEGALAAQGRVTGIIPTFLQKLEVGHNNLHALEVVDSMHQRKARMCDISDAFCILPGGLGTLDEAFEIITWKQLGLHDKPIVLVNLAGFWDPLIGLIGHQSQGGYIRQPIEQLFTAVAQVDQVFEALAAAPEPRMESQTERL